MQQIFRLRSKNRKIPDIKVTQTQTTKLLTRLIGKSSSDDNLTSNTMKMPCVNSSSVNEFDCSNLKAKSLSTNEIRYDISPGISRTSSANKLNTASGRISKNYLRVDDRPASYHGSLESLERNKFEGISEQSSLESLPCPFAVLPKFVLFHCPYESNCRTPLLG